MLWVPELDISVSPSAGEDRAGSVGYECEGIDGGRDVVDESTSVDLHGVKLYCEEEGMDEEEGVNDVIWRVRPKKSKRATCHAAGL